MVLSDTDESRVLQGTGEVTFSDVGTFTSEGVALAYDFTGNFTRKSAMLVCTQVMVHG